MFIFILNGKPNFRYKIAVAKNGLIAYLILRYFPNQMAYGT